MLNANGACILLSVYGNGCGMGTADIKEMKRLAKIAGE